MRYIQTVTECQSFNYLIKYLGANLFGQVFAWDASTLFCVFSDDSVQHLSLTMLQNEIQLSLGVYSIIEFHYTGMPVNSRVESLGHLRNIMILINRHFLVKEVLVHLVRILLRWQVLRRLNVSSRNEAEHFDLSLNTFLDLRVLIKLVLIVNLDRYFASGLDMCSLSDHGIRSLTQHFAELVLWNRRIIKRTLKLILVQINLEHVSLFVFLEFKYAFFYYFGCKWMLLVLGRSWQLFLDLQFGLFFSFENILLIELFLVIDLHTFWW